MSEVKIEGCELKINIIDLVSNLDDETLDELAKVISWDRILYQLDGHLKGTSGYWSLGNFAAGHHIREHIEKVQGTKDERVKDLEHRIRSLEGDVRNYKKYYEWYWKWYHSELVSEQNKEYYLKAVGEPTRPVKPANEEEGKSR